MERELLINGLYRLHIEPSDVVVGNFMKYLYELKRWSSAYNLTALKRDEEIITKHFFDSLLYLKVISAGNYNICDVGSGAGFPGMPMAIVNPKLKIALVEPSRKKCAFLRHIKRTLSVNNVDVLESRIEDVKDRLFDIAVTRALFSAHELIKKTKHAVKENGFFVLNKGPAFKDEIKGLPDNVKLEITTVALPGTSLQRNIIKITPK